MMPWVKPPKVHRRTDVEERISFCWGCSKRPLIEAELTAVICACAPARLGQRSVSNPTVETMRRNAEHGLLVFGRSRVL
jgi:hypothetical protein